MIFISIAICVVIISVGLFVQKVRLKARMKQGLGRKVKDSELTSLNAWMDAASDKTSIPKT